VRNLPDGRVEAVVAGPAAAVQAMLDAVARSPGGARVDAVATRLALEEERAQVRRPFAVWRDA
jgi:acylphosphatase